MKVDSCRKCGNTLSVLKYCKVCSQPIQFQCKRCFKYADDPIHTGCEIVGRSKKTTIA